MKYPVTLFFLFALLLSSCSLFEEEARPATTVWNLIAGSWKVDHAYTINGLQFGVRDCTKDVIYKISQPSDNQYEPLPRGTSVHDWLFGRGNPFISIENYDIACLQSNNPERYDFFIPMRGSSDREEQLNLHTGIFLPDGKASKMTVEQFLDGTFAIRNFDAAMIGLDNDRIDFEALYNVYGRRINGQLVYDTVRFSLIRTNVSPTFVIEAFSPDKFRIHADAFVDRYYCDGDNYIYYGGISEKCAFFNGSYGCDGDSDFNHKLKQVHDATKPGLTYSFWIKPGSIAKPEQILFSKYDGQYGPYKCSLLGGQVALFANDGFGNLKRVLTNGAVTPGVWNHICITVLDNFVTIYLNGQPDVVANNVDMLTYDTPGAMFYLGTSEYNLSNNATATNYQGFMDEFFLYEEYLAPGVIRNMYAYYQELTYDPEAQFLSGDREMHFEEIHPSDLFGNARVEGNGVLGNCLALDGFGDAHLPYPGIVNLMKYADYWLLSFWIKPNTVARDTQVIASNYNPEYNYPESTYRLYLNHDKVAFSVYNATYGGYMETRSESGIAAGEWTHVYISVEKGVVKIYLDGVPDATRQLLPYVSICGWVNSSSGPESYFGTTDWHFENGSTLQDYNGKVDEFLLYQVPEGESGNGLTEMELSRIHQWYLDNGNL
ncbi:MAG: LamG domain-containing protein [Phaeodactylibacter sp.]|nr:LamG domain-containing protein [Phaeodactylibacter sp.]MCB9294496.1 LamG domain-containing protein [Lewinellaceae bacterium]